MVEPETTTDASEALTRFRGSSLTSRDDSLTEFDSIGYDVDLTLDDTAAHEAFRGTVKGLYVAKKTLSTLELDFEGNTVDAVSAQGATAPYVRRGTKLIVTLPRAVNAGDEITTSITYHGDARVADGADPNDFNAYGGFMVKRDDSEHRRIFTTLSWPYKARRWIPLHDHPSDGAMLAMKVTAPNAYTVVANGKRTSSVSAPGGARTWQYEALTPMPPYDFHVSAYDNWAESHFTTAATSVPVSTYVYAHDKAVGHAMLDDTGKALDFYASAFGAYRWGSLSYQEEPIFGGGMEHASCVSLDETLFSSRTGDRETAFHELAHHWSGNLVRIRTWNDFWLSEGFADYLTGRSIAAVDGDTAAAKYWKKEQKNALTADGDHPHALRPADPEIDVLTIFDDVSYAKGASVLRMLEHEVGTAGFTTGLQDWFDSKAFSAQTTKDFEAAVSAWPAARGVDVAAFFRGFVYGKGHPELRVTHVADASGGETITVEQLQSEDAFVFTLDLAVKHGTDRAIVRMPLTARSTTLHVDHGIDGLEVDPDKFMLGTVR